MGSKKYLNGLRISSLAENDLRQIAQYTHKYWGKQRRDQYLYYIDSKLQDLLPNPLIGRSRDELLKNCRSIQVKSHVLFCRYKEDNIEILRILHKSMDIDHIRKEYQ